MRQISFILVILNVLLSEGNTQNNPICFSSPNGSISCKLDTSDTLKISILHQKEIVLSPSPVYLDILGNTGSGIKPTLKNIKRLSVRDTIVSPVPSKRKLIADSYNEVEITFQGNFGLIVRCYDDGVAFRYKTTFRDSIIITRENLEFRLPENYYSWFPEMQQQQGMDRFHTSFEENYKYIPVKEIKTEQTAFIPLLLESPQGKCLAIAESDLQDYPGMFVTGHPRIAGALQAIFPNAPQTEEISGGTYKKMIVTSRENYIAKTNGNRLFPWRVFIVAANESELPGNDLVYRLAEKSRLSDISWINPGRCTDEWIIGINLFNVPFKTGVNTESYKYYIDFAAENDLPYVMLDAGWSDVDDLCKITPGMDMDEILTYAHEKDIGLWLWTQAMTLDRQLDAAMKKFSGWGVKGIMTDFIDRNDQKAVNFYHRIAKATAENHLLLMFHGAFDNAGFERTWPNVLTREAVLGSEYNIWSDRVTPDHDLVIPFTRMLAGPLDYEPIVFNNVKQDAFKASMVNVMTMGTRIHQLAMYIVYDSPLQIFAGNPGYAKAEPEFTRFMSQIPTTWDETVIVDGKCGEYIITARKKDGDWYLAAMTNSAPRDLTMDLNFIEEGNYTITEYADGINADKFAADYEVSDRLLSIPLEMKIKLAPGGGYAAKITRLPEK
jgi:alpha-glucosidase